MSNLEVIAIAAAKGRSHYIQCFASWCYSRVFMVAFTILSSLMKVKQSQLYLHTTCPQRLSWTNPSETLSRHDFICRPQILTITATLGMKIGLGRRIESGNGLTVQYVVHAMVHNIFVQVLLVHYSSKVHWFTLWYPHVYDSPLQKSQSCQSQDSLCYENYECQAWHT